MKIGLLAPGGFDRGGQERVIPVFLWLIERLARCHEVHVITLNQYPQPDRYPLLGATVHNIGYGAGKKRALRQALPVLRLLAREHRRKRFDALHGLWATEAGLMSAAFGRMLGIPSVVTVAGGEMVALPEIGYGRQLRRQDRLIVAGALRLADAVTCATRYMAEPLRQRRPDVRWIPLGVDCACFTPPEVPPAGPPWRLLHVASLNRVKDQPTLLRAFVRILAAEPTARLDIVGEDTLQGEIQALARTLGLEEAVAFHGFEPSDRVAERLRTSHLLLHSSLSEAGQMVTLEAGACGVPCVGTCVGHVADLAPSAAVAVPIGDSEALARAALDLLRNPTQRGLLAQRALHFVRAHDADFTAERFEQLYLQLRKIRH